ncbi:hypothetical protein [Halalkalibacter urbisdiaboli]|uniref:hypothetical protein n=1 Tax=Halalkalibacter urbisdiaboli TaxID=1960589 RepID=UPI000B440468|nr:hypothetical protein [Halalkalibacter urbisdiaboli]
MVSFRGDAHKFYLKLKKNSGKGLKLTELKEIQELKEMYQFYQALDPLTLENIHYRMLKEKNGSGLIPILVTAVPWVLFIFSNKIQEFFEKDTNYLWLLFVFIYLSAVTISVGIHFREKAWATVHSRMIENIIDDKLKDKE